MIRKVAIIVPNREDDRSLEHESERLEMSYILDALKRAEQKTRRGKTPEPGDVEPAAASPIWQVKMVSPARYKRFRPKEGEGDTIGQKGSGVRKGVGIAAAVLALLLLIECIVIYQVRDRMSVIVTEATRLTKQMSETEALMAKREKERLDLKTQNNSLRQELEKVNADLAHARVAVERLKVREQRLTARKRQPTVAEQKRPRALPLASAPPPPTSYRPPGTGRPSGLDSEASLWDSGASLRDRADSVTSYSIRG